MDRRTLGGWISGPGYGLEQPEQAYRGEALGVPEHGVGSVAGLGRRFVGLAVDWFLSILITLLFFPGVSYGSEASSLLTLATFFVMTTILVALVGATIGHRVARIQVVGLGGTGRVPAWRALVRTVLLCLVIPAVVWDRDGRGLHDKVAATVVLRTGRPVPPTAS